MDSSQNFKVLQERISAALVETTRNAGQIAAEDLPFHRSMRPVFGTNLDNQSSRLLGLAQDVLRSAGKGVEAEAEVNIAELQDVDDVETNWQTLVDSIDSLLEKADTCLDEYTGVIKRLSPGQQDLQVQSKTRVKSKPSNLFRNQPLAKPQLLFDSKPPADSSTPFKPLLTSKPHAVVPLDKSLSMIPSQDGAEIYKHPYEPEITQLEYPPYIYTEADPIPYQPLETTSAIFVDREDSVIAMLAELKKAKEIAIDLEHHDTRSYVGLVSLMQISTRDQDWIVDTLKPWREKLQVLNEVFANPMILKVLHGAFMDIEWLQRDLGLYIVGLFDTYHACRALGYPQASLASLLSRFVNFDADKQYQLADWRIRSNPSSAEDDRLQLVLQRSKETSLILHERYIYDGTGGRGAGGWYNVLRKTPALFSPEQFSVFRAVHEWRDGIARQNDDSVNYVMPKHVLFSIARAIPLDMPSLLGVSHPISPLVRARASELLKVIKDAHAAGKGGPEMMDVLQVHMPEVVAVETPRRSDGSNQITGTVDDRMVTMHPTAVSEKLQTAASASVRSETSQFWGADWASGRTLPDHGLNPLHRDLRLALPLPPLTAEIFANPHDLEATSRAVVAPDPGALAEHEYTKDRKSTANGDDGVFIVKQLGGRSKRKNHQSPDDTEPSTASELQTGNGSEVPATGLNGPDAGAVDDEESEERAAKRKRRDEKKTLKRLKKEMEKRGSAPPTVTQNDSHPRSIGGAEDPSTKVPFDYINAESVLHAKKKDDPSTGSKKVFDPYSKSRDAPKGLGRAQRERAGKSFTFKS
ncbi:MAG: exosome nuclease subunit [Caeruleum heppii]|nr:MAG: exosome nuclease subunit [Caeruleum heppii]